MSYVKLVKDVPPFKSGEILTFGAIKDAELVMRGLAVWTKQAVIKMKIK